MTHIYITLVYVIIGILITIKFNKKFKLNEFNKVNTTAIMAWILVHVVSVILWPATIGMMIGLEEDDLDKY